MADLPKIEVSEDYQTYKNNITAFNQSLALVISDIYNKVDGQFQNVKRLASSIDEINHKLVGYPQLDSKINKLATDIGGAITTLRVDIDKLSAQMSANAPSVMKLNEELLRLSNEINISLSTIKANENELSGKMNKISETVYSGLPSLNQAIEDMNDMKRGYIDVNAKLKELATSLSSVNVQSNSFQLKFESLGKEFVTIEKNISDMQTNLLDFINMARGLTSSMSSYDPETLKLDVQKSKDRLDSTEKELNKVLDNYNSLDKTLLGFSSKLSELSVVKNATKFFEDIHNSANEVRDAETRINAMASKLEVMFSQISMNMNKLSEIGGRVNEFSKKLMDFSVEIEKLKASTMSFATKDDIALLNNKINQLLQRK